MRVRARLFRILRATAVTLLTIVLLAFAYVQIQQHLLRHRAERLLANFHALRLKQSNWQDAQQLITRWGAFGHYNGTCTAAECSYFISLEDEGSSINSALYKFMETRWPQSYSGLTLGRVFRILGGHSASMRMGFLVENGIVERSSVGIMLDVPPDDFWCDMNCGYGLLLNARAVDRLMAPERERPILGDDEQLAEHPNFKAGKPGGCEICMEASVAFTPSIDPRELQRITSYNMSCFAGFHICRTLPEVLPAARDWHLYPSREGGAEINYDSAASKPCKIPVFARTRDATTVLLVDAITTKVVPEPRGTQFPEHRDHQVATVRLVRVLKGTNAPQVGSLLKAVPWAGYYDQPVYLAENLIPGKRYVLIPVFSTAPSLETPHCGVFEDSPQVESEVERGLALNDNIRFKQTEEYSTW